MIDIYGDGKVYHPTLPLMGKQRKQSLRSLLEMSM